MPQAAIILTTTTLENILSFAKSQCRKRQSFLRPAVDVLNVMVSKCHNTASDYHSFDEVINSILQNEVSQYRKRLSLFRRKMN